MREAGEQGPRSAGPQASALLQACAIDSVRAAVSPGLSFSCTEAPLLSSCNVYDPLDTKESDTFRTDCRSTPPTFSGHTVPDPEAIPTSTRPECLPMTVEEFLSSQEGCMSQARPCTPATPALKRQKREDEKFKVSLDCPVRWSTNRAARQYG